MIITLISPDKLTLSMFSNFFRTIYSKNTIVIEQDINCLFSEDYQENLIKDIKENIQESETYIVKYKTKYNLKKSIPQSIIDSSDYVLKFDIYSTKPEILKVLDSVWFESVLSRWFTNIEKLDTK